MADVCEFLGPKQSLSKGLLPLALHRRASGLYHCALVYLHVGCLSGVPPNPFGQRRSRQTQFHHDEGNFLICGDADQPKERRSNVPMTYGQGIHREDRV